MVIWATYSIIFLNLILMYIINFLNFKYHKKLLNGILLLQLFTLVFLILKLNNFTLSNYFTQGELYFNYFVDSLKQLVLKLWN